MPEKLTTNLSKEVENIRFLESVSDKPEAFLVAQNQLLYNRDLSHFYRAESINPIGLPSSTDDFYQLGGEKTEAISAKPPRVLNLGSGSESTRRLPAINVDLSLKGKPDVVADASHLPFKPGVFSVIRASHVLEHVDQKNIPTTLTEWGRALHQNGELQLAVPDANITFEEIIEGKTPKESPAFSIEESTAPLAQIYGLGYENEKTDKRWLHKIIFSYSLLEFFLHQAGFAKVKKRTQHDDLAYNAGVDDDSQNHYSLLISAARESIPHSITSQLPEKQFRQKSQKFIEKNPDIPPVTFVIPTYNEERNIRHFLSSLETAENQIGAKREFIFVVNGCTDNTEKIITDYIPESFLDIKLVSSDKGVVKAFYQGITSRSYHGFVGKLDADSLLHPHALDLMHMFLVDNQEVRATYAEPTPIDSQFPCNEAEHFPFIRSKRLYIHGRASLYRLNPFEDLPSGKILDSMQVEDMFLSFFYAYFYGIDSIVQTPHALVYSKTVKNVDDLVRQISRGKSEKQRVFDFYPPFQILDRLMEREIYPSQYRQIMENAAQQANSEVKEWTQLQSTK